MLDEAGGEQAGGVFHCFTESADVARAAIERGYYISFSGIVSFKNAQDLRDLAKALPPDRILIETDSPYLAPVPFRGKLNTRPWCRTWQRPWPRRWAAASTKLAAQTTANTRRLFKLPAPEALSMLRWRHCLAAGLLALGATGAQAAPIDDLVLAAEFNDPRSIARLLTTGLDPNLPDGRGRAAIFTALSEGASAAVEALLALTAAGPKSRQRQWRNAADAGRHPGATWSLRERWSSAARR